MSTNSLEVNAYRYWSVCHSLNHWTDTATIVLCHLMKQPHPALKTRAQDLCRRARAAQNDGCEVYEEEDEDIDLGDPA